MNWKIEEAQQKFSEVMSAAVSEPQLIYNHDKLVAAVVEAELFQDFLAWQQQQRKPSLGDAFSQLRQLCAEENYTLEIPSSRGSFQSFC
jgi:hypothetical protein